MPSTPFLSGSLATAIGVVVVSIPGIAKAVTFNAESQVDVVGLTIQDIQSGLETDAFTSAALVESFLARIETYEPVYNAFTSFNPNALETARQLDIEYENSGPRSPLHGVPIVIKDAVDIAGFPTTAGYSGFSSSVGGVDLIPEVDAPIVSDLEAAGAVILGKTNLPAFAADGTRANSSYDGLTYNAFDILPPLNAVAL